MEALQRLLEVVRRELGADDARLELGGRDPDNGHLVWERMPEGWRVVAVFDAPPGNRTELQRRLSALLEAFQDVARRPPVPHSRVSVRRALDDELVALAERVGAEQAVIIDASSPVLWASSDLERGDGEDVEQMERDAREVIEAEQADVDLANLLEQPTPQASKALRDQGVERARATRLLQAARRMSERNEVRDVEGWRRYLRTARAVGSIRGEGPREVREERFGYLARQLAGIYWLVLAFAGRFSELHAEAAVIHATPHLERLLSALPPTDPGSGVGGGGSGGKVIEMPRS